MSLMIKTARAEQQGIATGNSGAMGDPGLFSSIGSVFKSAIGVATQFIPGPVGAIVRSGFRKFGGAPIPSVAATRPQFQPQRPRVRPGIGRTFASFVGQEARGPLQEEELEIGLVPPRFKARKRFGAAQALTDGVVGRAGIACPQGMRPNKSDYWRTNQAGQPVFVEAGTRCVSVRRRNPGNSRANDRAIARIASAKRMAKTLGRISIRKECP